MYIVYCTGKLTSLALVKLLLHQSTKSLADPGSMQLMQLLGLVKVKTDTRVLDEAHTIYYSKIELLIHIKKFSAFYRPNLSCALFNFKSNI